MIRRQRNQTGDRKDMRNAILIAMVSACVAGAAACSPQADVQREPFKAPPPSADPDPVTLAPPNPFFGTWTLENARIAPWWDGKGGEPAVDTAFGENFVLAANNALGPPLLTCDKPSYKLYVAQPSALFEGKLPDPVKQAAELGFKPGNITSMTYDCASDAADVSLDFAELKPGVIMFGLNNVLYTFRFIRG